jgi:hypothetical protein
LEGHPTRLGVATRVIEMIAIGPRTKVPSNAPCASSLCASLASLPLTLACTSPLARALFFTHDAR